MISREKWPMLVLLTSHWVSLIGACLITTAGILWLFVLSYEVRGGASHPYIGIVLFFMLPVVFVAGLLLIPLGIFLARRRIKGELSVVSDRGAALRRLAIFLLATTFLNLLIGAHLTYEGVERMESVEFCGQSCHVMKPHDTAYRNSAHSRVACVNCHVSPGAAGWLESKMSGTRQLWEVAFNTYSRPIPSAIESGRLVPANETCENCHWPGKFSGIKLRVIPNFAEDEANTATQTVLMMKIGGNGVIGIHGAHFGPGISLRFAPSDSKRQTIPWVEYRNSNGAISRTYLAAGVSPKDLEKLPRYEMQCVDCHNRPAHAFELPERAVQRAMASGQLPATLPFIHKKSVELLKTNYATSGEAATQIRQSIKSFYQNSFADISRQRSSEIQQAAEAVLSIYNRNVFPDLKVTWGTYPNNLGHTDFPGCFRCHDDAHKSSDQKSITQDCEVCHAMVAIDEPAPEILKTLGVADAMATERRK
jgi:hypothetical protein